MITLTFSEDEFNALTDAVDSAIVDLENYLIDVGDPLGDEFIELKDLLDRWCALKTKLKGV